MKSQATPGWIRNYRKAFWLFAIFFAFSFSALSQNTKGDKPARPLPRVTQNKKAKPSKDRAKTKDISGRRLRTKNKSSAVRTIQNMPRRRPSQPSRGDRAVKSERPVIKSTSAKAARNNVYPQKGPFVNNPSQKARKNRPVYSNQSTVQRNTRNSQKRSRNNIYSQSGAYVNNPSKKPKAKQPTYSNNSIVQRNVQRSKQRSVKNVFPQRGPYVNNPSLKAKDRKPVFNNRSLLARAFNLPSQSWPPGKNRGKSRSGSYVTRGKKNVYWGKFKKGERPITTDIAGRRLRTKNYRSPAMGFIPASNPYANRKPRTEGAYRGPFRFGFSSATRTTQRAWNGNISGHRLRSGKPSKPVETVGQRFFARKLSVTGSGRVSRLKGSGYQTRTGKGISNRPVAGKAPGIGASGFQKFLGRVTGKKPSRPGSGQVGNYQGTFKRGSLSPGFRDQGAGFSGNIKRKRPLQGGGSISGRSRNNGGVPVNVKAPTGRDAGRVGTFQGNIKGTGKNFRNQGEGYSGNIKGTGKNFRNQGEEYTGNMKGSRPLKGGGSISGRSRNNGGVPVNVKAPTGKDAGRIGTYQGNIKGTGKNFRNQGEGYTGNIKSHRPDKGGGSISGRARNNGGVPVNVKAPTGKDAGQIGTYQGNIKGTGKNFRNQGEEYTGNIKRGGKGFRNQGEEFSGNIRRKGPEKGVSRDAAKVGTFKGNNKVGDLTPGFRNQGEEFNGFAKTKKPVKNPNASELALKQKRPDETTYEVSGLQVKVKAEKYERNKKSSKESLMAIGPKKNSVRASEYSGRMKVYWEYKHNPSSSDDARKTIAGTNAFNKATSFSGRMRMSRNYRHNPNSDKEALKTFAPGRSYARINDFQGNFKMKKFGGREMHPDTQFAHTSRNNVKSERTFLTNIKLLWAKTFRKNGTQTKAVKQKTDRPRYDKKEKELWKDLYD